MSYIKMNYIIPKKFFICPICKKSSIPYVTAKLVIDHNHNTGNAREWICDSCNTGLGRFAKNRNPRPLCRSGNFYRTITSPPQTQRQ
jgi:RNase P subunit RPR2